MEHPNAFRLLQGRWAWRHVALDFRPASPSMQHAGVEGAGGGLSGPGAKDHGAPAPDHGFIGRVTQVISAQSASTTGRGGVDLFGDDSVVL